MRVIAVMDIRGGVVVHAVGGRRADYRPVRSVLTGSTDPAAVAAAFRERLGLSDLYVADLDAIAGGEPDRHVYSAFARAGHRILIDAGLREPSRARELAGLGAAAVAGLETLPGPDVLAQMVSECGADHIVFSLDLRGGTPLRPTSSSWKIDAAGSAAAIGIARQALEAGVRRMLLLDLARVGIGNGIGTEELVGRIRELSPDVELLVGGGVSGPADLDTLRNLGVDGVLVASALHDGRIGSAACGLARKLESR